MINPLGNNYGGINYRMVVNPSPIYQGSYVRKSTQEIFTILSKWAKKMGDGSAWDALPNPFIQLPEGFADRLVRVIDEDFASSESWRCNPDAADECRIEAMPSYRRLEGGARKAFAQEVWLKLQYQDNHMGEYIDPPEPTYPSLVEDPEWSEAGIPV